MYITENYVSKFFAWIDLSGFPRGRPHISRFDIFKAIFCTAKMTGRPQNYVALT